jgi:uncharacterized protein YyaL (SSP411 family)
MLDQREADLFIKVYGVESGGNFTKQATGRKPGTNILYLGKSLKETAADLKMPEQELQNLLAAARQKLFAVRESACIPERTIKF